MSEGAADTPAPRRSQREKKQVKPFVSVSNKPSKRKRRISDTEDEARRESEPEDQEDEQDKQDDADDADSEADDDSPRPKVSTRKAKGKRAAKSKDAPPAKKPRITKIAEFKKPRTTTKKARKPKEGDDTYDATQVAKDTKISADNPLFNAIMNPSAALQSTTEDWLESLQQATGAAQAEMINLVLRSCGCNDSVNSDEVVDYDGVLDMLDNFTEALKQENSPIYPLTSKLPIFKRFRKSLSEFIERLISSSAELGVLYTSDMMATLQTWVVAMSSSQIRSFRHTATVVALEVETALCDVAASVEKEAEVVGRQRAGEKKRKATNKGGSARDKELEAKAQEIRERRTKLAEFLKEFVDGVFVHRYRDLDPNIRAECVRAIGLWFKKYPGHFLDATYLRYVGWVLSDSNTHVRLEAVKSLSSVYEQTEYIGSLNHFTERFKPRLIEMATCDTELSVRVAVIHVLSAIDGHSLLEDEEREKLCFLIFDEEARVRRAVSQFVKGVWEEAVDERLVGRSNVSDDDRRRAGLKALAALLVKWGKALDKLSGDAGSDNGDVIGESQGAEGGSRSARKRMEVLSLVSVDQKSRVTLAVDALWDDIESIRGWQELLDLLLLDHSAAEGETTASRSRGTRANGKTRAEESIVDEAWRLQEEEESILLEVLVASLRRTKYEAAVLSKKGEEENVVNDITRELIKGLPRLFIKHQTDQSRIVEVLSIPSLMNLDLYLEMRMITGYANLWDDVTKQFLSHSSPRVLSHAMSAIRCFMDATSLSNTNNAKILELEDELSTLLHDVIAGREEIEVASFTEDEVLSLGAICTRLAVLSGTRNLTGWMEEEEGGKQSSAWNILSALVDRGRLGYKEEETMIVQALNVLTLHIMWKAKALTLSAEPTADEIRYKESLVDQRATLLEKLVEYAIGTQSNTVDGVKRTAFKHLLDLHVLFSPSHSDDADIVPIASVSLTLDDEVQYRCAGYIQAEIERYAESLHGGAVQPEDAQNSDTENSSEEERGGKDGGAAEKRKRSPKAGQQAQDWPVSQAALEQEYLFIDVVSTFLRAIRAGTLHIRHGAVLLAHYGRLGPTFDVCAKVVVDILREEGMMKNKGELVVAILTQALQEAFTLYFDGLVADEDNAYRLSKVLSSCFVIRGSQLSVVRRLDPQYVIQIHTELLSWIVKRLDTYQKNKNKRSLKQSIAFFRVLVPLLSTVQSRDALTIKAHMEQLLAEANIEVPPTSKLWEPQRAYEKRLTNAMTKDKVPKPRKASGKAGKNAATSDEDDTDGGGLAQQSADEAPRPPPRRSARNRPAPAPASAPAEDQDEMQGNAAPTTPKARPRPRPVRHGSVPPDQSPALAGEPPGVERTPRRLTRNTPTLAESNEVNGHDLATPKPNRRKRAREEAENQEGTDENNPASGPGSNSPGSSHSRQPTPPVDLQFRKKRVRH